ncbi:sigma 54-interacting transcriptional regulator [Sphaerochaeta sp. PS]|uniref:sigma 54-interacting transcriptional regulator n=1 Tax=Sphaerochaeta sp. PS TaxID=3076336 RepID=UPI0028A3D80C|nr:sigma 54-interacting transcriptional regulator [Sphaerochaeta sp. PS]MDT4762619.1 sigma 54-interacting transcriptional regulator [Sphaerochaeta sp. PS]
METNQVAYSQQLLGESEAFLDFQSCLSRAATVNRSVLLVGERGSGKEGAARRLHFLSPRWQHALVTVNCAALPPSLIETELFGYEQGAFTGAQKTRKGRFEEAEGGTLFLDEIGLIPLEVQEKILRVVEYGTFERVGSSVTHEVDVRIIGATNADLPQLCKEGKFKEDLLDRLSFEVLFLPPLRERGEDILLLATYFGSKMALECGKSEMPQFSKKVMAQLEAYSWPGNVRELKNVVERAVYRSDTMRIEEVQFDPFANPYAEQPMKKPIGEILDLSRYEEARQELELSYMKAALQQSEGNQRSAAKALNLSYDQFRGLFRKYKDRI